MNVLLSQAQKIDTLTAIVQTQGKEITALQLRSCPTSNEGKKKEIKIAFRKAVCRLCTIITTR